MSLDSHAFDCSPVMPMPHSLAAPLFRAVGASPLFVDDVLGDLEEVRVQRATAGQSCGRLWYGVEIARAFPHAARDGLRGVGVAQVLDWGQKALAAWVLLGMGAFFAGAMSIGSWRALQEGAATPHLAPSPAVVISGLLLAGAVRFALLGYIAAWMERERPLVVTLTTALLDLALHALVFRAAEPDTWLYGMLLPVVGAGLTLFGGVWRVILTARRPRVC
jgi:hypothetical protein